MKILLTGAAVLAAFLGKRIPAGFLPDEDQGYLFGGVQLPDAASQQRNEQIVKQCEEILKNTPGVKNYSSVVGYSMLSGVANTYSSFFFIQLKDWSERTAPEENYRAIRRHLNTEFGKIAGAVAMAFPPPAIPGVGTSGGVTFVLEDRAAKGPDYLATNLKKLLAAAGKRPEFASVFTTALPSVRQVKVDVDNTLVLQQGVRLQDVYQTMQCFMGGAFVNYFSRFADDKQ